MASDGQISLACLDELAKVNKAKGSKADWWVLAAGAFVDKPKGCKCFKESILQDFSTWSILGSFLASISFTGAILDDDKIVPHGNWKNSDLGYYLRSSKVKRISELDVPYIDMPFVDEAFVETATYFLTITFVMLVLEGTIFTPPKDLHLASVVQTVTYTLLLTAFRHLNSSSWEEESLVHVLSTIVFMHAFVSSLRGVIAGLFKYLYFVPCPAENIMVAVKVYIEDDMNCDVVNWNWKLFIYPCKYWDHIGPIIRGGVSLCVGAFVMTWIKFGIIVAVPIFLLAIQFYLHVWDMKKNMWDSAKRYLTIIRQLHGDSSDDDDNDGRPPISRGSHGSSRSPSKTPRRQRASSSKPKAKK
jgi:hypothetical protein